MELSSIEFDIIGPAFLAGLWRKGLGEWGQEPERIGRFDEVAKVIVVVEAGERLGDLCHAIAFGIEQDDLQKRLITAGGKIRQQGRAIIDAGAQEVGRGENPFDHQAQRGTIEQWLAIGQRRERD